MPTFEYTAVTTDGKQKTGVIQADTSRSARQLLREKNLHPINIISATEKKPRSSFSFAARGKRTSIIDLALVTRQLATLLSSGIPVADALGAVAEQSEKPAVKTILLAVHSRVTEGYSLAKSMEDFPHFFPDIYRSSVSAGEASGYLDDILLRLADYSEQQMYLRQKVKGALIYPAAMIIVSILVVSFLLVFVVPSLVSVFEDNQQVLPLATVVLLSISSGLSTYGIYGLMALVFAALVWQRLLQRPHIKRRYHEFLLKLPMFGNAIRTLNIGRYARTFKILAQSSVPAVDAMIASAEVVTNLPMQKALQEAAVDVRQGTSIYNAIKATGYFPPMSLHLISTGESSGRLADMLERVAHYHEQQIESLIEGSLKLFEPLLVVIMGGIVLFIVLAILLPIFDLNQLAQL